MSPALDAGSLNYWTTTVTISLLSLPSLGLLSPFAFFQISFSYTILTPLRFIFCSYQSYLESASNHLTPFIKYCLLDTQQKYTVLTDILQPISALMLQVPCVPKELCTFDISMALFMCPLSPSTHVCLLKTHLSVRF